MTGAIDKAGVGSGAAIPDREPLMVTRALSVGYDGRAILPPIDLEIGRASFWAIVGHNGAGKSTFVRTLLGLDRAVSGTVGRAADLRPCYLPQQATLDPIFPVRVLEFVLMGVLGHGRGAAGMAGPARRADVELARAALDEVRAGDVARRLLRDLSGGQRQRALLARALAARANLYVLDEPTAALDITAEREALDLLTELRQRRGATILMITHLVEEGLERADRVLVLDREHGLALSGTPEEMVRAPALQHLYGPLGLHRGGAAS